MATFNYRAASASGHSDDEIRSYLADHPDLQVVGAPETFKAQGPQESGNMEPGAFGLMDPLNWLPYGKIGEAGVALGRAGLGALGRVGPAVAQGAGGALARGAGGAALEAGMEFLPPWLRIPARGAMAMARGAVKEAPQAAPEAPGAAQAVSKELGIPLEQAAAEISKPLVGHEAQLFRTGGMGAVVRERIAKAAEGAAPAAEAPVAPTQAARIAATDEGKAGLDAAKRYWQMRTFAMMKQAGMPTEAEGSRAAISKILGRDIKSRAELSIEDWTKVHAAAEEKLMQDAAEAAAQKASQKAATAASRRPVRPGKVVGEIKPKAGVPNRGLGKGTPSAPGPSFEVPGQIGAEYRGSLGLTPEQNAAISAAMSGNVTPETKALLLSLPVEQRAMLLESLSRAGGMR